MKHLKKFETVENKPQIGDYIVLLNMYKPLFKNPHAICKIDEIENVEQDEDFEDIKKGDFVTWYKATEINQKDNTYHWLEIKEIDFFSPNIEEIMAFINSNKYNL